MSKCGSCGAEAIDGFSFCHECGAPLVKNGGQFRPSPPTRVAVAPRKKSLAEWTSLGLATTVSVLYWWAMPFSVTFGGKLTSVLVVGGLVFVLTYNSKPTAIVKTARLFAKVFAVCAALSIAGSLFDLETPGERRTAAWDQAAEVYERQWLELESHWNLLCHDNSQPLTTERAIEVLGKPSSADSHDIYWSSPHPYQRAGEVIRIGIKFDGIYATCYKEYWK